MDHVLSTYLLVNHRLTNVLLDRIYNAGIPAVEIFCARQHFDYRNRAQVAELGHWFRDSSLKLHSLHLPMHSDEYFGKTGPQAALNITDTNKAKRIAHVDEIKRALEVAETIPCRYAIQHVGIIDEEYDERKLDAAFSSLEELRLFAKARDVEILLENIPNAFSSAERLMAFIRMTHLDLNFCFDTGHANLHQGVEAEFEIMKERIRSTHVHDNDGETDSHLFPLSNDGGKIDWRRTMSLFRSAPGQFPLLLELREPADMEKPALAAQAVFEKLESIS